MKGFGKVNNPLTIIGIFAGIIEVSGISILPHMEASVQDTYVWFLIFFPILLVMLFFVTLWRKREVLYAPSDFRDETTFYRLYENQNVNNPITYSSKPFNLSSQGTADLKRIANESVKYWHPLIGQMNCEEFFVLHSKYYEIGNYTGALICIDIAISKGKSTSQAYSYRSATLRRLGRLTEAINSASYAITQDHGNIDAHFNLAVCYKNLAQEELATKHLDVVLNSPDKDEYIELIEQYYGNYGNS